MWRSKMDDADLLLEVHWAMPRTQGKADRVIAAEHEGQAPLEATCANAARDLI
jgi:hypothetical protein